MGANLNLRDVLLAIIISVWAGAAFSNEVKSVYFKTDSAKLSLEALAKLSDVVKLAKAGDFKIVLLIGSADMRASNSYNFALAKRRAQSVKKELRRLGLKEEIRVTLSSGEEEPRSSKLADNRRVDIHLIKASVVQDNMLILHLGLGQNGLHTHSRSGQVQHVDETTNLEAGATYMRRISDDFHLGASIFTNPTVTINFGFSF